MTDYSKLLNPEQCAAATAGDGPLLVLAAAGTGKTRTLVYRLSYLIEKGVDPSRIILLTFTNRAAQEMLDRARKVVGEVANLAWSGTFHSICARFLRKWGSAIGIKPSFKIIDEDDQKKLIAEVIKSNVAKPGDFVKKEIALKIISEAANDMLDVGRVADRWMTKTAGIDHDEFVKVANAYSVRKSELGVLDFDDLLVACHKLLKEKEHIRKIIADNFLYVLVDEYQDTNALQAEITDIIAAGHRNIMAVGDDFQCIYTWRGARIENILDFPDRWEKCAIIKLERNYRSRAGILDVANSVMRDAPVRFEKHLKAMLSAGDKPRIYRVQDGKDQAQQVLKLINEARACGYANRDIAILYRSHFQSIDVEKAVSTAKIPYRLTSGIGFFEKQHVKDVLAFMRLIIHPDDELSFLRLVQLLNGVGEAGAKKAWAKIGRRLELNSQSSLLEVGDFLNAKARPAWKNIAEAFSRGLKHIEEDDPAGQIILDFLDAFYEQYLHLEWESEEAQDRLADIKELASDISDETMSLDDYLENAALMTNLDIRKNDPSLDRITLSTIHQAKGMEWPCVIIPWLSEGMFPSAKAEDEGRLDEERRLFYVAVTRAKERLSMLSARMRRMPEGGEFPVEASKFLKEMPKNLVNIFQIASSRSFYPNSGFSRSSHGGYNNSSYNQGYGNFKTTWRR